MLRTGYYLRPPGASTSGTSNVANGNLVFFSLAVALESTLSMHADTEFGFPKGRRNINETDVQCALREFSEETGVDAADVRVVPGICPFEEVFSGSNGVRYRHVYYLAELRPGSRAWEDIGIVPVVDPVQLREVKAVGWFEANGVRTRIREENVERREVFRAVHDRVRQAAVASTAQAP